MNIEFPEKIHGIIIHFLFINKDPFHWIPSQPDIVCYCSFGNLVKLLMHHGYTILKSVFGICKIKLFTLKEKFPFILLINTEKTFHKSRFTGSVFTHKRMNCSGPYIKTYIFKYPDSGKRFTYIFYT